METTSTNITIAWDAVSCIERNSNITGYVVRYTPPSTSGTDSVMVSGTGDAGGMVTIDGLAHSTQYSIRVAAVNSNGNIGVLSTVLSVQTACVASKCTCVYVPAADQVFRLLNICSFIIACLSRTNPNCYFHVQAEDNMQALMPAYIRCWLNSPVAVHCRDETQLASYLRLAVTLVCFLSVVAY